jgi:antitoxin HicB
LKPLQPLPLKKVLAFQIEAEMQAQRLTKTAMAQRMHTRRAALNRLLDDKDHWRKSNIL